MRLLHNSDSTLASPAKAQAHAALPVASPLIRLLATEWVVVLALFLFGLVLRLYGLDGHGLWYDEATSIETANRGFDAIFSQRFGWLGNQTPWHYLLVWLTSQPVDPTTTTLFVRLPSALAGALTVIITYGLGRETFGRAPGIIAALMLALSVSSLDFSQDLRPYALTTCLIAASVYCMIRAGRTGLPKWWLLFTLASGAALYMSYTVLTLAYPPLILAVLTMLVQHRRASAETKKATLYALGSLGALAVLSIPILLDLLHLPGSMPNLSLLSLSYLSTSVSGFWTWNTRFGLPGLAASYISFLLLLLAIAGMYLGVRRGGTARVGSYLCTFFMLLPAIELSVLGTTKVALPRYLLFALPFYLLLISNALWSLVGRSLSLAMPSPKQAVKIVSSATLGLLGLLYILGAYNYYNPQTYSSLTDRPDYRSALAYLRMSIQPADTIVFATNPDQGLSVTNVYWKSAALPGVYDAVDPRLMARVSTGDVYWVVSTWGMNTIGPLLMSDTYWAERVSFGGVVALKQAGPDASIASGMNYLATRLQSIAPDGRLGQTLSAVVAASQGDAKSAAAICADGPGFTTLWKEYLTTSNGFASIGDHGRAWREAISALLEDCSRPEVHTQLSQLLLSDGYDQLGGTEAQIASILATSR